MPPLFQTHDGFTEAIIDEDGGLKRFYEVANLLSSELNIRFDQKLDDIETLTWDFRFKGQPLSLYYNIYTGICLYPQSTTQAAKRNNQAVAEIAHFLESKLQIHASRKFMS
ncbi:MAG TPA: hypothetical protein VIK80_09720 [Flavihumibacter sp.]|jgi:hypothetical protein